MSNLTKLLTLMLLLTLPLFSIYVVCNTQLFNSANGTVVIVFMLVIRVVLFYSGIKRIVTGKSSNKIVIVLVSLNACFFAFSLLCSLVMIPYISITASVQNIIFADILLLLEVVYYLIMILLAIKDKKENGTFPKNQNQEDFNTYRPHQSFNRNDMNTYEQYCRKCGYRINQNNKFCQKCGTAIINQIKK